MKKVTSQKRIRYMCVTAVLAAVSSILMFLEFPVPLMPAFIQMDFSEMPALLASFGMGPIYGVVVCLIKNLLHMLVTKSMLIGEVCNFLLGICFVLPAGFVYKFGKSRKSAMCGMLFGMITMTIMSLPINYFISYPMYQQYMPLDEIINAYNEVSGGHMDGLLACLIFFNMPFTLIKGLLDCIITFFIYKPLSPLIKGVQNAQKNDGRTNI